MSYTDIDLENFDLDPAGRSEHVTREPEPAPVAEAPSVDVGAQVADGLRQGFSDLARTMAPPPAPLPAPELPKWDSFDVPVEITAKLNEDPTAALRDFGRHVLDAATPVFTRGMQNAAAQGAQWGSQQAIAAIEGQRMANEHAPTFQRLPEGLRQGILQEAFRDPAVAGLPNPADRWKAVEARTQAIAAAFGAQAQAPASQPQGYAGSSVRSDIAPSGSRAASPGKAPNADDQGAQIAAFMSKFRR